MLISGREVVQMVIDARFILKKWPMEDIVWVFILHLLRGIFWLPCVTAYTGGMNRGQPYFSQSENGDPIEA